MSKQRPEWLNYIRDQLFEKQETKFANQNEIKLLNQKQAELEQRLKSEIPYSQFQMIQWEEVMNRRHSVEIEWMYAAGLKDGMKMIQEIQKFLSD